MNNNFTFADLIKRQKYKKSLVFMNLKKHILLCITMVFFGFSVIGQNDAKTFKVVIDAGHGGGDSGCLGSITKEKDVNLYTALKLGKLISENCPEVQVIYTRKTDVFVELYRRAEIANSNHANLFISIHCNASENHAGNGVETFVMGLAKSEANQAVARKENAAMLMEKNYQNNYDGFNPTSPESNIIFSLYSSAYLSKSITLAEKVQKNLLAASNLTDRGVKQAGYWVLYKVAMPSILIELGFLSNPKDEEYLAKLANQDREAIAIYNAFVDYLTVVNGSTHKHLPVGKAAPQETTQPTVPAKTDTTAAPTIHRSNDTTLAAIANTVIQSSVCFKVQFLASPVKLASNDKRLQGLPKVDFYQENGLWKYTAGIETDYSAALETLSAVKEKHPDAFLIAFNGSEKISVPEARKMLKK